DAASMYIVVGHQADEVKRVVLEEFGDEKIGFCVQERQFGTGDAVNAARRDLENRESILLILSGDVPMIRVETLNELVSAHTAFRGRGAACTVLSVRLKDPTGY